jgi:hypothetical protein
MPETLGEEDLANNTLQSSSRPSTTDSQDIEEDKG